MQIAATIAGKAPAGSNYGSHGHPPEGLADNREHLKKQDLRRAALRLDLALRPGTHREPGDDLPQRLIRLQPRFVSISRFGFFNLLLHLGQDNRAHRHQRLGPRGGPLEQNVAGQTADRDTGAAAQILQRRQRIGRRIARDLGLEIRVPVPGRPGIPVGRKRYGRRHVHDGIAPIAQEKIKK
jgi:hypothetical protein